MAGKDQWGLPTSADHARAAKTLRDNAAVAERNAGFDGESASPETPYLRPLFRKRAVMPEGTTPNVRVNVERGGKYGDAVLIENLGDKPAEVIAVTMIVEPPLAPVVAAASVPVPLLVPDGGSASIPFNVVAHAPVRFRLGAIVHFANGASVSTEE